MKVHYIQVELVVELEDNINPYNYMSDSFDGHLDIVDYEITNVESKQL